MYLKYVLYLWDNFKINDMINFKATMYVIANNSGLIVPSTLDLYKSYCISRFSRLVSSSWKEARKAGYKCEKVNVSISSVSNIGSNL